MTAHLLDCSCGAQHSVTAQQAGGQIACRCGATVAVPTLRKLRELPVAERTTTVETARGWGPRMQVATLGGLLALGFAVTSLWAWCNVPNVPEWDDLRGEFVARRSEQIEDLPPVGAFMMWHRDFKFDLQQIDSQGLREVEIADFMDTLSRKAIQERGNIPFLVPGLEGTGQQAALNKTTAQVTGALAAGILLLTAIVVPMLPAAGKV